MDNEYADRANAPRLSTAPANNGMGNDIENALKQILFVAQCVDRVHRDVFPGMDDWQDRMMKLADEAQANVQKTRKLLKKMQIHYEQDSRPPQ